MDAATCTVGATVQTLPTSSTISSIYKLAPEKAALVQISPPHNLTIFEAAAYARCSPRKMRELVQAGVIRHARIGKRIVIRRETIDQFLGAAA